MNMGQMPEYKRGRRDGFRFAITWLHTRANEMNDHHAKSVLNSAAFALGVELREAGILSGRGPETIEVNGVWYDRRDTVDALTSLLAEARIKIATYKEVIRGYREKELADNPTPPPKTNSPI